MHTQLRRRDSLMPEEIAVQEAREVPRGGILGFLRVVFKVAVPGPRSFRGTLQFGGGLFAATEQVAERARSHWHPFRSSNLSRRSGESFYQASPEANAMSTASVTSRGQATIPKRVPQALGITPGSEVEFDIGRGAARLRLVKRGSAARVEDGAAILDYKGPRIPIEQSDGGAVIRKAARRARS
jgi:bifunctional DNA-binding transcriptional regulator/antitoxin component of YhaV-PrlF toxin-antitoxin module